MAKTLADAIGMEVRTQGACRREYDFTVSQADMARESEMALREISMAVNIPGFRPGKAPAQMIRSRYAAELKEELGRRIFYTAYQKVMADESLDVVGCSPAAEPEIKPDAECKFTLNVDIAPEFELGDYKALKVDLPKEEVTDAQLEERVTFYRKMYGDFAEVGGPAQAEDMLKVAYSSDFALPEGASPALARQVACDDTFIWLSEPETIPGTIAALTGAEIGKEYAVKAEYAADSRETELAGKTVNYKVKVLGIRRRSELSDEQLCAKTKAPSLEAFKAGLRGAMEQEVNSKRQEGLVGLVYEKLSGAVADFELPPGVLETESGKELRKIANEAIKSEEDAKTFEAGIEAHRAEAAKRAVANLRKTFILRKIAKIENIEITREEFESQLKGMSHYYGYKESELRSMLEKTGGMDDLQLDMLNQKVLIFLAKQSE